MGIKYAIICNYMFHEEYFATLVYLYPQDNRNQYIYNVNKTTKVWVPCDVTLTETYEQTYG